jgi:zinc protease
MNPLGMHVEEHRLPNGLVVLLVENHTAPLVCVSVWYRVGSRDDPPGKAGMAHLLEHMLFKGTPRYPRGAYDQILHRLGASANASTSLDRTNYYVLSGSDRYGVALDLEADRMRNVQFAPADLADEQRVVLNELAQAEDDPASALHDQVQRAAFAEHPYGHPVLGWREEVASITPDELRAFYDDYYQPGNAYLVVAGDFEPRRMLAEIEAAFGPLPTGAQPDRVTAAGAAGAEEQRVELRRAGEHELLLVAYRAPARGAPESYAHDVLAQILGRGRTSRLYRALVEPGHAVQVSAANQAIGRDPFLFVIEVELPRSADAVAVESILAAEIEALGRGEFRAEELARARKRARAGFILRGDRISTRAFLVGESEAVAGWRFMDDYLQRVEAVTPADLSAAARGTLDPAARIWGHFRPRGNGDDDGLQRPGGGS